MLRNATTIVNSKKKKRLWTVFYPSKSHIFSINHQRSEMIAVLRLYVRSRCTNGGLCERGSRRSGQWRNEGVQGQGRGQPCSLCQSYEESIQWEIFLRGRSAKKVSRNRWWRESVILKGYLALFSIAFLFVWGLCSDESTTTTHTHTHTHLSLKLDLGASISLLYPHSLCFWLLVCFLGSKCRSSFRC